MKRLLYLADKIRDNKKLRVKIEGKEYIALKNEDFRVKVQKYIKSLVKNTILYFIIICKCPKAIENF